MNRPSEPFNAEERDLAERLARLGGPREPAPALDARILAMAREAVAEPPPAAAPAAGDPKVTPLRPRKPTPRWPLGMGLAASLVLAAGIGWRMHDDGRGLSEDAAASAESVSLPQARMEPYENDDAAGDAVMIGPPLPREEVPAPAAPPPMATAETAAAAPQPQRISQAAKARAVETAPVPAQPAAAPMSDAMVPDPPVQAAPEAVVNRTGDATGRIEISGSRIPRTDVRSDREVGAAEYTRTPLDQRREQQGTTRAHTQEAPPPPPAPASTTLSERNRARPLHGGVLATPVDARDDAGKKENFDERPPVSADSPEFRQAWLQRIRELVAKGDEAAARDSLQEYRRRYPETELPEDLRKLAATLPPPTP